MDLAQKLRPFRKKLVTAAEEVMKKAFDGGEVKLRKTQLNHLVAVCNEATCSKEIENYIRYQASRKHGDGNSWTRPLAENVIEGIGAALKDVSAKFDADDVDRGEVEAWRLYAVFLTRAFTYRDAAKQPTQGQTHDRTRR